VGAEELCQCRHPYSMPSPAGETCWPWRTRISSAFSDRTRGPMMGHDQHTGNRLTAPEPRLLGGRHNHSSIGFSIRHLGVSKVRDASPASSRSDYRRDTEYDHRQRPSSTVASIDTANAEP